MSTPLDAFLRAATRSSPPRGAHEAETADWLAIDTLPLPGGVQWAGDPQVLDAEDGLTVDVPPGDYRVEAKGLDIGGYRTVARVRVVRRDVAAPTPGDQLGETGTDSAQIAVCDILALDRAVGTDHDHVEEAVRDVGKQPCGTLTIRGVKIVYCITGGDGTGPVVALRDGDAVVGVELPFR